MPIAIFNGIPTRQAMYPAAHRDQPHPRFGQTKTGMFGGDDYVAGHRDFEPAAQRETVDRGDQGLVDIEARDKAAKAAACRPAPLQRMRGSVLEVITGGERLVPRPRHHADPDIVIEGKVIEHISHLLGRRRMNRVHHLRPVEGDIGQMAALLILQKLQIHWVLEPPWRPAYSSSSSSKKASTLRINWLRIWARVPSMTCMVIREDPPSASRAVASSTALTSCVPKILIP